MARKAREPEDDFVPAEPEVDPDVDQVLAELGGHAATVQLHRQSDRSPTCWNYHGRMDAAAFSLETVKEEFGGGIYRARILDGTGHYVKHVSFSIDPRFRPSASLGAIPLPGAAAPASPELVELRELVKQQTELLRVALTPRGATDPLDLALRIGQTVKAEMAPAAATPVSELLAMFKQRLELARPRARPRRGLPGAGEGRRETAGRGHREDGRPGRGHARPCAAAGAAIAGFAALSLLQLGHGFEAVETRGGPLLRPPPGLPSFNGAAL